MHYGMPSLLELDDLKANVALAQNLGLDFVEINCNVPEFQIDRLNSDVLLELTKSTGIHFTFHLDEMMSITDPNKTISDAYIDSVLSSIRFAKKANIESLTLHLINGVVFTLPHKKIYVYEKYKDYYLKRLIYFRDCVTKTIGESKISLNIENVAGFEPYMKEGIEHLLQSPVFGLTYDCGHNQRYHQIDWDFLQTHVDRIRHMHAHDCQGQKDHLPFGEGSLDIPFEINFATQSATKVVLEVKTAEALSRTVQTLRAYQANQRIK